MVTKLPEGIQRLMLQPYDVAESAAKVIQQDFGRVRPKVAMILGSGFADTVKRLGDITRNELVEHYPGFLPPTIKGHAGRVMLVRVGRVPVLVFSGRSHLYEKIGGHLMPVEAAVHRVRVAAAMGCESIVLTNAVGGLDHYLRNGTPLNLGDPALVSKHYSRLVPSPLSGPRFLQCHDLYSLRQREAFHRVRPTKEAGLIQVIGPHFEDIGEKQAFLSMGFDMVGMSVVIEAIAAADAGMESLALSVITDYCAEKTSHDDVLKVVRATARKLVPTWQKFIPRIA